MHIDEAYKESHVLLITDVESPVQPSLFTNYNPMYLTKYHQVNYITILCYTNANELHS